MREFLFDKRSGDVLLSRRADLRDVFLEQYPDAKFTISEFNTVISHLQAQGLIWRFSFGDFVLMKPELLNNYASAIVLVARRHTKGLGCVLEEDVVDAKISFEDIERINDENTEKSMLHAVIELCISREVALRESGHLVFPSKFNRERPEFPKLPLRDVAYKFSGPIEDIYATLVVRLYYCGAFELKDLWKNAAEFYTHEGKVCGFLIIGLDNGNGIISVFFEDEVSLDSKVLFLQFIHEHLQKRGIENSVSRERIYRCSSCYEEIENKRAIEIRLKKGLKYISCQFCEEKILLIDLLEEKFGDIELLKRVRLLEKEAEERRMEEISITTVKAKEDIGEFDVFIAHNSSDKSSVKYISRELRRRGLNPWLDKEQIPPGRWFQEVIQKAILNVNSAAIIIGLKGLGKWQSLELTSFVSQCIEKGIPVIPVLLPGVKKIPDGVPFLKELNFVRFDERLDESYALDQLEWGVTGERPQSWNKI